MTQLTPICDGIVKGISPHNQLQGWAAHSIHPIRHPCDHSIGYVKLILC